MFHHVHILPCDSFHDAVARETKVTPHIYAKYK